jgi:hypothetical protein
MWWSGGNIHACLISALNGGEWSTLCSDHFSPRQIWTPKQKRVQQAAKDDLDNGTLSVQAMAYYWAVLVYLKHKFKIKLNLTQILVVTFPSLYM